MQKITLTAIALLLVACGNAGSEQVGAVDTVVTCYVSRAKTGGLSGAFGLAEDKAEASIACRQVGPITFVGKPLEKQEEVYSERISLVFKKLRVVRMIDAKRNTLVYLTYSDRVIEGSPQNSVTAVALPPGTVIPLAK